MAGKGFKQLLMEASAGLEAISVSDAMELVGRDDVVFVDVRESHEHAEGFIPGSIHAARGFLEFIADPEGPAHDPAFTSGKRLVLYCGSGARGALAGKTLRDMGVGNLANLTGGFQAWLQAGGPLER